jgi:hypothetical protein
MIDEETPRAVTDAESRLSTVSSDRQRLPSSIKRYVASGYSLDITNRDIKGGAWNGPSDSMSENMSRRFA